jgi:C4-dicarboxylate-binding protein DctP
LPKDVRSQLAQILREVTETRNAESTKVNLKNRQAILDAGGTVRTLTAAQRQAWVDAMKPVWKKFENDIGADLMDAALASN